MYNLFKDRILKYFLYFILLSIVTYGGDYFFRPEHKDIIRTVAISSGLTIGIFIALKRKSS